MKLFKNKWFWIGAGVVVTLIALVGAMQARKGKSQSVTVTKARTKDVVMTVKAPGAIEPRTIVKSRPAPTKTGTVFILRSTLRSLPRITISETTIIGRTLARRRR